MQYGIGIHLSSCCLFKLLVVSYFSVSTLPLPLKLKQCPVVSPLHMLWPLSQAVELKGDFLPPQIVLFKGFLRWEDMKVFSISQEFHNKKATHLRKDIPFMRLWPLQFIFRHLVESRPDPQVGKVLECREIWRFISSCGHICQPYKLIAR